MEYIPSDMAPEFDPDYTAVADQSLEPSSLGSEELKYVPHIKNENLPTFVPALIEEVRQTGSKEALGRLAQVYYPTLLNFARRLTSSSNRIEAEDLVQDAIFNVFSRLERQHQKAATQTEPSEYLSPQIGYFLTAVRRSHLDDLKSAYYRYTRLVLYEGDIDGLEKNDGKVQTDRRSLLAIPAFLRGDIAEDVVNSVVALNALSKIFAALSAEQQEALSSRLRGADDRATEAELGIKNGVVRSRVFRAFQKLQKLREEGYFRLPDDEIDE